MNKGILNRDINQTECDWLDRDFKKGETVYKYQGYTYGVISPDGEAFTIVDGIEPFFELPIDAITFN